MDEAPSNAEDHLLSDFVVYKSGGRSSIIQRDMPRVPVFYCPGCDRETMEPEHGHAGKCPACGLNWLAMGNNLRLWRT